MDGFRVLIIEDHEHTRVLLGKVFESRGWRVVLANTVADGLAALEPAPDCVILDLNLPDGPGEGVLRAIAEHGLTVKVVAVITAGVETSRMRDIAAYRPNLMIMKPLDWDVLYRYCESEIRPR